MKSFASARFAAVFSGAALVLVGVGPLRAAEQISIISWGGAYAESQRAAYFTPFTEATGIDVVEHQYNGDVGKLREMVEANAVIWDILDVEAATAVQGCGEGLFEPIDWARVGDRSKFIPGAALECGVGTNVWATIFAYDAERIDVKDGPKSWADFWSIKKWPGKRGLRKTPKGNLEFALMADGVPIVKVYEVLGTEEGITRAFEKMEEIKSQIVWWEDGSEPPRLLAEGEVTMTTSFNGRIFSAAKAEGGSFEIVWDGQLYDFAFWTLAKGAPHADLAYKFLAFASDPKAMARQSSYISYGPVHVDAIARVGAEILPHLPTAPDNFQNALAADHQFWAGNQDALTERFNTWLGE